MSDSSHSVDRFDLPPMLILYESVWYLGYMGQGKRNLYNHPCACPESLISGAQIYNDGRGFRSHVEEHLPLDPEGFGGVQGASLV